MFQTFLTADLPSEEVVGAAESDRHGQTHDRVTFSVTRLLGTLQRVFEHAGIRDITYAVIDDKVVYRDDEESDYQDLDQLLTAAKDEGFHKKTFAVIAMGLSEWRDGVQHIIEARARMEVPAGEHELQIRISSRPDDCNARRLDDAERYARRLAEFASDIDQVSAWRNNAQGVANDIVGALRVTLFGRSVSASRTELHLVRPSDDQLRSMAHITFGERIVPPRYTLSPPRLTGGAEAWPDPAIYVYDDPFLVFRHWALLTALMVGGSLRVEWVTVTDTTGKALFQGHKAKWFESWPWGRKFEVEFIEESGVKVHFFED